MSVRLYDRLSNINDSSQNECNKAVSGKAHSRQEYESIGASEGGGSYRRASPLGPNLLKFMQFWISGYNCQNNRMTHPLWGWRSWSGKFWIRHWNWIPIASRIHITKTIIQDHLIKVRVVALTYTLIQFLDQSHFTMHRPITTNVQPFRSLDMLQF